MTTLEGPLVGAVLTGGQSRRFGTDKALATAGSVPLGQRVVNSLRAGGVDPVVAVGGEAGSALGLPTIPDLWPGEGPLAAVATVALWAKVGRVLVVPCDLPRLDPDDVARIVDAAVATDHAVAASIGGQLRIELIAIPASYGIEIRNLVSRGERRFQSLFDIGRWKGVEINPSSLDDVDTRQELDDILRAESGGESGGAPGTGNG